MKQEDIFELHCLIEQWGNSKGFTTAQMLGYLSATMIGTLDMWGYSEEFVKNTFDKMFMEFKKRRSNE